MNRSMTLVCTMIDEVCQLHSQCSNGYRLTFQKIEHSGTAYKDFQPSQADIFEYKRLFAMYTQHQELVEAANKTASRLRGAEKKKARDAAQGLM